MEEKLIFAFSKRLIKIDIYIKFCLHQLNIWGGLVKQLLHKMHSNLEDGELTEEAKILTLCSGIDLSHPTKCFNLGSLILGSPI